MKSFKKSEYQITTMPGKKRNVNNKMIITLNKRSKKIGKPSMNANVDELQLYWSNKSTVTDKWLQNWHTKMKKIKEQSKKREAKKRELRAKRFQKKLRAWCQIREEDVDF